MPSLTNKISFKQDIISELIKVKSQKKTYIVAIGEILLAGLIIVGIKMSRLKHLNRQLEGMGLNLENYLDGLFFSRFLLGASVGIILPLFICTLGGDLVAGETQDGSLKLYASRSRSRLQIILPKAIALFISALVFTTFIAVVGVVIGTIFFGKPGTQVVPLWMMGLGREVSILSVDQAIYRYIMVTLYASISIMNLGAITLFFSCVFNRMTSATVAGITLYFVSYVLETLPFIDAIKPYLLSKVMNGSIYFWVDPIPWGQVVNNLIINAVYVIFFTALSVTVFKSKDIQ